MPVLVSTEFSLCEDCEKFERPMKRTAAKTVRYSGEIDRTLLLFGSVWGDSPPERSSFQRLSIENVCKISSAFGGDRLDDIEQSFLLRESLAKFSGLYEVSNSDL